MSTGNELVTASAAHKALSNMGGGGIPSLIPQTIDEVYRFSQLLALSGLTPKGIVSAEQVTVQILMGFDLGLKPMQAVQNINVINGRPSIGGDLALAVLMSSGQLEEHDEGVEGEGDARVAWCRVKRKGMNPIERRFSVVDAKRAGLWDERPMVRKRFWNKSERRYEDARNETPNEAPWYRYPDRMLCMRARGFAFRDRFSDVLKGMHLTEEMIGHEEELPQQQVSGPSAPPPPPPAVESRPQQPSPPANTNAGPAAPPAEKVEEAEIVEAPAGQNLPQEETELLVQAGALPAEDAQHPPLAQEEAFDPEAWLAEVQDRFQEARTPGDVDGVHEVFGCTANDLLSLTDRQKYQDMHEAAVLRTAAQGKPEQAEQTGQPGPAPGVRYFIHPESSSYFTTDDGSGDARDPLVEEVDAEQFAAFKARVDAAQEDDDDSIDEDDFPGNDAIAATAPPPKKTDGELYVERIRAALDDQTRTFQSVAGLWNATKEERAALIDKGEITKEQSKELQGAIKARKAADAPAGGEGPGAPPPESEIDAMDRTFRADVEACQNTDDVAALVANTMVARNKFSGTQQHKDWTALVAQRRKQLSGVA